MTIHNVQFEDAGMMSIEIHEIYYFDRSVITSHLYVKGKLINQLTTLFIHFNFILQIKQLMGYFYKVCCS